MVIKLTSKLLAYVLSVMLREALEIPVIALNH